MQSTCNLLPDTHKPPLLTAAAIFLLSAALIALELFLMRCLSVSSYHHFSYLVISTALLGFGAAGTFQFLFGRFLLLRFRKASYLLCLLFALSSILCFQAAQALPLDIRYLFFDKSQAAFLIAYHLLILFPFFTGALLIILALTYFVAHVPFLYASNLIGSGAGAAFAILTMCFLPPEKGVYACSILAVASGFLFFLKKTSGSTAGKKVFPSIVLSPILTALFAVLVWTIFFPVKLRIDSYKDLARLRELENQGEATHVLTRHGPRGRIDIYDSPHLHTTLFASLAADVPPPAQMILLTDGVAASPVFRIRRTQEAGIMNFTPSRIAYSLVRPQRVLLLGEKGGINIWLARLGGAKHITVVQPDGLIFELMQDESEKAFGSVFSGRDVQLVCMQPRTFLEHTRDRFDLIQLVSMESQPVGSGGLYSLHENYLMTVEGMAAALERLQKKGVVSVTRGLQTPPRDNLKIMATMIEALERKGYKHPQRQIIQLRNYLAGAHFCSPSPFEKEQLLRLRGICGELMTDIVWAPDIKREELNRFDKREGPRAASGSYYHHAARELLEGRREKFYRQWAYRIEPATDDSPYYHHFFKWRTLPNLIRSYGKNWLQSVELGYFVLILAICESAVVAVILIIFPLLWVGKKRKQGRQSKILLLYFALIGTAYMSLEIVFIQKFTFFLGDPVYSASVVVSAFLVFSGLGSLAFGKKGGRDRLKGWISFGPILAVGLGYLAGLNPLLRLLLILPLPARILLALLFIFPLSYFMGKPFPLGISLLERKSPRLVPMAWAVNGFFSVIAASGAVALSMTRGFSGVIMVSLACYALAAYCIHLKNGQWNGYATNRSSPKEEDHEREK